MTGKGVTWDRRSGRPRRTVRINAQGNRLTGTVVSWDVKRDLAILEVPDLTLPALPMSTATARGQWAMAAGAPLGYRNSISVGVISAVVPKESTLSTDAVIGPGSSGGPLVNSRGEVVGIIAAVWEDAQGISLATQVGALCMKVLECEDRVGAG
jgi:S1-C subfamily serine protease